MKLSRETLITAAVWLVAPLLVLLAIVGGVRGYSAVPFWDMWHGYLDFHTRAQEGDWLEWWTLHNEHRIVLARLLFWVDLAWFRGTVWFLIVVNYLLVLGTCLTFRAYIRDRAPEWRNSKAATLVTLLVCGWLYSWVQQENLTWGFQSQFFLAQLLPLLALYHLYRTTQAGQASLHFVWACMLGILSIGTMGSGILALPIMCCYALFMRMERLRTSILITLTLICLGVYFVGYHVPESHGSPLATAIQQPKKLLQYVLLYLGSPFYYFLGHRSLAIGQIFGLLLVVLTAVKAIQPLKAPRQHPLEIALLAFLAYIVGTALGTGGGRLVLQGLQQATSSRYTTPALMAWAALLVLYLPSALRHLSTWRHRVVWPLLLLLLLMLAFQLKAARSVRPLLFEREVAALAIAMGIPDEEQVHTTVYSAALGIRVAKKPVEQGLSIFGSPSFLHVRNLIGQRHVAPPATACTARLTSIYPIDSDPRYVRVRGWFAASERSDNAQQATAAELIGPNGVVSGYVLATPRAADALQRIPSNAYAIAGYLRSDQANRALTLATLEDTCSTSVLPPAFRAVDDPAEFARSGAHAQNIASNQGWSGSDFAHSFIPDAKVFGSYMRGDADVGTLTLKLHRGSSIYYRSGPTSKNQRFSIDDGHVYAGELPTSARWVTLVFDSPALPEQFTLTLADRGAGWGEWSAIALRESP